MTDNYDPTTEEVRNNMAFGACFAWFADAINAGEWMQALGDIDWPSPGIREATKGQFDAWLASVKAEAWAEGYHSLSGLKFAVNQFLDNGGFFGVGVVDALDEAEEATNPYRKETP